MSKFFKVLVFVIIISLCLTLFVSCGVSSNNHIEENGYPSGNESEYYSDYYGQNEFNEIIENDFVEVKDNQISTFSLSVNTAGYSLLRRTINNQREINKNQVKVEEMINYFKYDYPDPEQGEPLSLKSSIFDCPWSENKLLTVGLKAEEIQLSDVRNNIVFLIDVSGSMRGADRIELLKESFIMMLDNLNEDDLVSIVVYASEEAVLLRGEEARNKTVITDVIEGLNASGSTAGSSGIQSAYSLAQDYFLEDGNNRVILATDGDFNVGITSQDDLEDFISEKRDTGIYLSVLGYGYGNLKDNRLETLANKGNGNYGYIDTINEARRVLVDELCGTLNTVARDAKAQVVFNPAKVKNYRLIGYENLLLTEEEFEDSETDAGEIGSGFTLTAVYEVTLEDTEEPSTMEDNFCKVEVRYKSPDISDDTDNDISIFVSESNITNQPSEDMLFISAVVETCLVLRDSEYKGSANLINVLERLNSLDSVEDSIYREEFKDLIIKLINNYNYDE